jgi:transcriptional regulator with XRE-family HTH domain
VNAEANPRSVDPPPHALKRYRELVDQLGDELGKRRGWRQAVAERLGVHPAHITRLLKGERRIGWDALERAASALGISVAHLLRTSPFNLQEAQSNPGLTAPVLVREGSVSSEFLRTIARAMFKKAAESDWEEGDCRMLAEMQLMNENNVRARQVLAASGMAQKKETLALIKGILGDKE